MITFEDVLYFISLGSLVVLSLSSGEDKFNKCIKDGFIVTDQTTVICKAILKK